MPLPPRALTTPLSAEAPVSMNGNHPPPCVLVVSGQPLFGTALRIALRAQGADAHHVRDSEPDVVLAAISRTEPAVVVLDLARADGSTGTTPMHAILEVLARPGRSVLVLRGGGDDEIAAAAVAAGAVGVVDRAGSIETLLRAVTRAAAGLPVMVDAERHAWLALHVQHQQRRQHVQRRMLRLSPRELQVLHLLAEGRRRTGVAAHLAASPVAVRGDIHAILTKLEVNSQLEAVALFFDHPPGGGAPGANGPEGGGRMAAG